MPWRFSVPLPDPQVGISVVGPRTFATVQDLLWCNSSPVCGAMLSGSMVGLTATSSKRAHLPRGTSQDCWCQCHCPHSKSLLTPTSTGDPPTSWCLVLYIVGSLLLSPVSWYTQDFVVYPLCFPQSCGSPANISHWLSKSDSLRILSHFAGSPGWEAWQMAQNLHNSEITS